MSYVKLVAGHEVEALTQMHIAHNLLSSVEMS